MADSASSERLGKPVESAGIIDLYINTEKDERKERKKV
jgi:hypothetical protein